LKKTVGEAPTGSFSFILTKNICKIADYKSNQKKRVKTLMETTQPKFQLLLQGWL
jgi:hypothetical protein